MIPSVGVMLVVIGFGYSIVASIRAHRETGEVWMLFFPHWIGANRGVSTAARRHGKIAFGVLCTGMAAFMLSRA